LNANVILISKIVKMLIPRRSHLGPNDLKPRFGAMNSESTVLPPFLYHSVFLKNTTLFQGRVTVTKTKNTLMCTHLFGASPSICGPSEKKGVEVKLRPHPFCNPP
jgi:hypothetical protein